MHLLDETLLLPDLLLLKYKWRTQAHKLTVCQIFDRYLLTSSDMKDLILSVDYFATLEVELKMTFKYVVLSIFVQYFSSDGDYLSFNMI